MPAAERPSLPLLDRLAHEFLLRDELDSSWAARPMELQRDGDRAILLLEDPGGEPLERLLGAPMEAERFLTLAIGIAAALGKAHRRGLIHKDVKPANILVNCCDGKVRLTGFGVATRAPRERQPPEPPEFIAGTLAYMAPEQTGRMNRSIDTRSDLYALGVTFYRMLTGALPFSAADPLEWVHCHVARKPASPAERLTTIPAAVSEIIMRLLAKDADERYQTTSGLEHDLRRCLSEWRRRNGRIEPFALGERDQPDRLAIPEKLYGREREVETLLEAFERVAAGRAPELVLIAGPAGVGKSAVAQELHRTVATRRGLFASGKFDQLERDIPYASLTQALKDLMRPLLGKSEAELAPWRAALAAALGSNGALMTALIPDLELLIGPQPPAAELPPQDAQRRFQLVLRRTLALFARAEHPLALFLDDLQWLDAATLDLLEDLLTQPDLDHLLIIGAYRDDEVAPAHPLTRRLAAMQEAGGRLREIALKPLLLEDVDRIVAGALRAEGCGPLARLVHEKTAGNPFFVTQFLAALSDEGLLAYDRGEARWTWDLEGIGAKGYTDNVADLVLGRLRRLPGETHAALKGLACLGAGFSTAALAIALGARKDALHKALREAVQERLLAQQEGAYLFLHDRVREAAYALIPESERAAAHLAIGRRLAAHLSAGEIEENVFEIVGQLNRGNALIRSAKERAQLAQLNLIAGRRAKAAAAHASALTYFATGAGLLPKNPWRSRRELAFALELNRAECEFLTGALVEAEARLVQLAERAAGPAELATIARLRVDLFMTLGRSDRAVTVGLECLRRLGIALPTHPSAAKVKDEYDRLWARLGDRRIEDLINLPPLTDRSARAAIDVLTSLVTPALYTDQNLRTLIIGRMGALSLKHGDSDASAYAYTAVGNVLCLAFGDYKAGFRFAELGLDLVERPGMDRLRARVYLAFGNLAKPSPRHPWTASPVARRAFETALQAGDLTYAGFSRNNLLTQLLARGAPLAEAQREAEAGLDFARRAGFGVCVALITAQLCLIRTLRGLTPVFGCFSDDEFDDQRYERQLDEGLRLGSAVCLYWIRKLQARYAAGDSAGAIATAAKADRLLWMTPAVFERADYHLYAALALTAACDTASEAEAARYRAEAAAHGRQLEAWAGHCPENFAGRAALVAAETARLEGRELDAERLYEEAIRSARGNGLIQIEALSNELAARFYAARGFATIAHAYLHNARYAYARWGADGKARQLDETHPHLATEDRAPSATSTMSAPVEQLDLATVIKVSQDVSSEIVIERLIDTIMRTALEQAGAERGLLLLAREAGLEVAAEAAIAGDAVAVRLHDEPIAPNGLPRSVINTVQRKSEAVMLDDATLSPFSQDPYVRERRTRSILCLPLLNQGKLIGALYLENNLAPRVFAPARIAVLKLLTSQAATALENTKLYRDLAEREAKIRRLVDANIIGVYVADKNGRIIEANDAFLRMIGYEREDLDQLNWRSLTPREWLELEERNSWPEYQRTGSLPPYEKEYFRKDGGRVRVLIAAAKLEQGREEGVAFVLDLSERERAQSALREAQAQLAHANRLETMGQMTASIAHEVNQPVAAMLTNAQAALRWLDRPVPDLDEVKQALGRIVRDGTRAGAVVQRIRNLTKKAATRVERIDINEAALEVIEISQSQAIKNGVALNTELAEGLPPIAADRVQLQQVILNLIVNAIEAMGAMSEGPRELRVATARTRAGEIMVSVSDSGPGLAPEAVGRLFDAFYTTKADGLGMGLSICRSIIDGHGGRLWGSANAPRGAVFQFTLPIVAKGSA
jgi:PAS domain S-box-containing protein